MVVIQKRKRRKFITHFNKSFLSIPSFDLIKKHRDKMFYPSFLINLLHVINAEAERKAREKRRPCSKSISISLISAGIVEKNIQLTITAPSINQVRRSHIIWFFTPFPPFITKEIQAKIREQFFRSHTKAFVFSLITLDYLKVIKAQLSKCIFLPAHIYFSPKWGDVTNFVLFNGHGREEIYKSFIEKKRKFAKTINLAFLSQKEKDQLMSFLRKSGMATEAVVFNDFPSRRKVTLVSSFLSFTIEPWPVFNALNYVAEMERKNALNCWFELIKSSKKEWIHKTKASIIQHLNNFALSIPI